MLKRKHALYVVCSIFLLLTFFPVQTQTYDALTYVLAVKKADISLLLHPHHVLYGPVCLVAHRLLSAVTPLDATGVMQLLGCTAIAVSWLLVFRLLRGWGLRVETAIPFSLASVLSYAPWRFATVCEPYAFHVALTAALFLAAERLRSSKDHGRPEIVRRESLFFIIALLAVLNLESSLLFFPSAFILACRRDPYDKGILAARPGRTALLLAAAAALAFLVYWAAGIFVTGSALQGFDWLLGYAKGDRWMGASPEKALTAFLAATDSIYGPALATGTRGLVSAILLCISSFFLTLIVLVSLKRLRRSLTLCNAPMFSLSIALILHFCLFCTLDAGSPCYWTIIPFLVMGLLAVITNAAPALPSYAAAGAQPPRSPRPPDKMDFLFIPAVVAAIPGIFVSTILPQADVMAYRPYHVTLGIARCLSRGDELWMMGGNVQERLFQLHSPWIALFAVSRALSPPPFSPAQDHACAYEHFLDRAYATISKRLVSALRHGRVLLFRDLFDGRRFLSVRGFYGHTPGGANLGAVFSSFTLVPYLKGSDGRIYLWSVSIPRSPSNQTGVAFHRRSITGR